MHWTGVHNLVEKARTGDSQAQADLYQMVEPFLLQQAKRFLAVKGVGKSVRDLVGDTWVRVLTGQGTFRGGNNDEQTGAILRAWLATTMRNVLYNDLRRPTPYEVASLDGLASTDSNNPCQLSDSAPTPSTDAMDRERQAALQQALTQLDATDRYIVRAVFFEDMSYGKIAKVVQLTYDQVRYRFHPASSETFSHELPGTCRIGLQARQRPGLCPRDGSGSSRRQAGEHPHRHQR